VFVGGGSRRLWILHTVEEDFDSPSADGAGVISKPFPLNKSRNVVPLQVIGSMLDGTIE